MFDRKHIERVLTINGVSLSATDDEIRTVLLGAHYSDDEVATALTALRSNSESGAVSEQGSMQKLMRTDKNLSAKEISKLLGINVVLPRPSTRSAKSSERSFSVGHHIAVWSLAVIIAVLGIGLSMYALEFGLFHPATALTFYEDW
jgi:hypothetical protein